MCGCEIKNTKAEINKNKCTGCGGIYCQKHLYTYVDGNNSSITKNSKQYCETCYINKYKS